MEPKSKTGREAALRVVEYVPKNQRAGQDDRNGRSRGHAAEQWHESDHAQSPCAADGSQNLRAPVVSILERIDKMLARTDGEDFKRDLHAMQRHARDLLQLIDNNGHCATGESLQRFRQPLENNVSSVDDAFLKKAVEVVEKHLEDDSFSVEDLAREMCMSRVQFHRRIRALTNKSTTHFIHSVRLQHAALLLEQHAGTVTQIAYQVGFGSHPYFTKCFQAHFGMSPKEYKMHHRRNGE